MLIQRPSTRPILLRLGIVLLATATIAAACGSDDDSGGDGGDSAGGAANTLVVLHADIAEGLDQDGSSTGQIQLAEMSANLYDTLFAYPAELRDDGIYIPDYNVDQSSYVPVLAESYENDGMTWTVKLRDGVESCAGNTMTADDVVWSFERAKAAAGVSNFGWFMGYASGILPIDPVLEGADDAAKQLLETEVRKVDELTVEITQLYPNELFPRLFTVPMGTAIFDKTEAEAHATSDDPYAHEYLEGEGSAGFGAYCVDSWDKGKEYVLAANANYWRGAPQYDEVIIRKVPQNSSRVAAISRGDADIVTGLNPEEYAQLEGGSATDVLSWQNENYTELFFNFGYEPWNLPNSQLIREAVAYAIPYDEIIKSDYLGKAQMWRSHIPSPANGYSPFGDYETDLDKAKDLLAEAGFPNGEGLEAFAQGFEMYYPAERGAVLEPLANRIRTSLESIGMPVTLHPIPLAEFAGRQTGQRDMGMFIYDFGVPYGTDGGYIYQLFFLDPEQGALLNGGSYRNPETDELYLKTAQTVGEERQQLVDEIYQILMEEDMPGVPIAEYQAQVAVKKGVSCWVGHPDYQLRFWFLRGGGEPCPPYFGES